MKNIPSLSFLMVLGFLPSAALAAEQSSSTMENILQTEQIVSSVAAYNLGYLTIAIAIILGAGLFFYVFNFRPLERRLEQSEDSFREISEKQTKLFDEQRDILNTVSQELKDEAARNLAQLQKELYEFQIDTAYNEHYAFQIASISFPGFLLSDINALLKHLLLNQKYQMDRNVEGCLRQIIFIFDQPALATIPLSERAKMLPQIQTTIATVQGHEDLKAAVIERATHVLLT